MSCGSIDLTCTACRLSRKRKQVVPGNGWCESRIMFVGEAPGREEDLAGRPFVGRGGRLFDQALAELGVRRQEVYVTNIAKCRPPENRKPRADEIMTCTSLYLVNEIESLGPKVICALGQTASDFFIPVGVKMSDLVGEESLVIVNGRRIKFYAAYHPAAVLYQRRNLAGFKRGLRAALRASGMKTGPRR